MNDLVLLIEGFLAGEATAEEQEQLDPLLATDPRAAELLASHARLDALLRSHFRVERRVDEVSLAELVRTGAEGTTGTTRATAARPARRSLVPTTPFSVAVAALALAATAAFVILRVVGPTHGLQPTIAATHGEVQILRDGQRISAEAAGKIRPGERILTGPDGTANLRLADGTTIRVDAATDVGFAQEKDAQRVQLKVGALRCEVTQQRPNQPLVFQTPHAELTVLGTTFELTATPVESRVRVLRGRVRWTTGGRSVEVAAGELSTADTQGLQAWEPVCELDFITLKTMPPQLETVFCDAESLHTAQRKIVAAPGNAILERGGLRLDDSHATAPVHGLVVTRWTEAIGGDVALEADVSAGKQWSLGVAVDGDSFQGYRIIFIAPDYPNGISVDSIYPVEQTLLAQDPRPIPPERDHTLRVEKRGPQLRVWVDRELRIDTELAYSLAPDRQRTFAISNFGFAPHIRSLRVWKGAGSGVITPYETATK